MYVCQWKCKNMKNATSSGDDFIDSNNNLPALNVLFFKCKSIKISSNYKLSNETKKWETFMTA